MALPVYDPTLQATGLETDLPDFANIPDDEMTPEELLESGGELEVDAEGNIIAPAKEGELMQRSQHNDNLISLFDEKDLKELGAELVEAVEADDESRADWYKRVKRGLEALGIYESEDEDGSESLEGVTKVTHPMIMEAVTQFQARAFSELYPSKGPVKAGIIGEDRDPNKFAQAERVERFMNYQLTVEDRDYYDERDQMLFMLPLTGSEFDKQYYCPVEEKVLSRWIRCDDLIVNNKARSLKAAPRVTHRLKYTKDEFGDLVEAGSYVLVELEDTDSDESNDVSTAIAKIDEADGGTLVDEDDELHTFFEVHTRRALPKDIDGGYSLPYIITVCRATSEVASIRRNWKESDSKKAARTWFTHKKFLPGFGLYGFGLLHVIGSLGEAATKAMNILLDAGAYASLQGGFKSKDAKISGDIELVPGQWTDTEMTAEELSKAFYTPNFKEPSQTLFSLLGQIVDVGRRFASTVDAMVGDAGTSGPVGNIVAQIEQGSKVFSGIHRRLHKTIGDELINIAALNGEHLPDAYPFTFNGVQDSVLRADFDDRIDVLPVSDPNIFSASQRIALAQSAVQTIQQYPQLNGDLRGAVIELLNAMHFPNPERFFPAPESALHTDPVTEGVYCTLGKPVKAFIDQNHDAHLVVHQFQLSNYQQQQNAQALTSMQAHIQEHAAMQAFIQIQMQMQQAGEQAGQQMQQMQQQAAMNPMIQQDPGFQQQMAQLQQQMQMAQMVPSINWDNPMAAQQMPPEMENAIALQAAQVAQQMMAQMQQQDPEAQKKAEQQQADQAKAMAAQEVAKINAASAKEVATINANAKVEESRIQAALEARDAAMRQGMDNAQMQLDRFKAMLEDKRKREETATSLRMDRELLIMKLNAEKDAQAREHLQTQITSMDERMNEPEEEDDDAEEANVMKEMMTQMMDKFSESMKQVADTLAAPKKLIMDKAGKPVGVESGKA